MTSLQFPTWISVVAMVAANLAIWMAGFAAGWIWRGRKADLADAATIGIHRWVELRAQARAAS